MGSQCNWYRVRQVENIYVKILQKHQIMSQSDLSLTNILSSQLKDNGHADSRTWRF